MQQGRVITKTREQITAAGAAGGRRVQPGTVLLSFKLSVGKVAIAGMPLYTNEAIAALPVKDPSRLDEGYLLRALETMKLAEGANRAAMGATLNKPKLLSILVPVPSLREQRRITAILDQADALRAKRRQVLTHLGALTQSIFHKMFGDPDATTVTVPFKEVAKLSGGRNLVADDSTLNSAYRVLKISAVTTGQFKPSESKPLPEGYEPPAAHLVHPGDLLMSRANTTDLVGAVALVDDTPPNLALPDKVWRFDWLDPESEPVFYHALFRTLSVRRRISRLSSGTGGSMKNVSKAKLETMPLPRVSSREQREFANRIDRVGVQRLVCKNAQSADDELFASLQSLAFRGKL